MKFGLLTFVCAQNWGAVLQGYSTQEFINNNTSHECEVLNWEPVDNSLLKPYKTIPNLLHSILHISRCKQRIQKFENFRKRYIKWSPICYTEEEREKLNEKYQAFIVGSDQVWITLDHVNPTMFLNFVSDENKKISYAPSFGADRVNESCNSELKAYIEKFDAISVREASGVDIIRRFSDIPVQIVTDPVFLNSRKFWSALAKEPQVKEKYIFLYPTQITKQFCDVVKHMKKKYGLSVYTPFYISGCKTIKNMGILEFLGWIKKAEYVFATSFHATAFSIIFEKEFWAMPHTSTGARIIDMLESFGIKDSLVYSTEDINYEKIINYNIVSKNVDKLANSSKQWLIKALDETNL